MSAEAMHRLIRGAEPLADVFMSYVREDRVVAEQISRGIGAAGISVWWDRHIHAGAHFGAEIDRELDAARIVVVLWSAASQGSDWVRDEASHGRDHSKLIPVCIDAERPPLGFRQIQSLDFQHWNGDPNASAFVNLLGSIQHYLGRSSTSAPDSAITATDVTTRERGVSKLAWIGLGFVAMVAVAAAFFGLRPNPATTNLSGRIEIDRFEPATKTDELEHFAKGVADTMVRVFTTNDMKIVTRAHPGIEGNANPNAEPEFVLRGMVDRDGDKFVVGAELLHRREGLILYSNTMQRDAAQATRLEDQFSATVAGALHCALRLRGFAKNDPSLELFSKFLAICAPNGTEQAQELAQRIVEVAPQYPLSYVLRALANAFFSNVPGKSPDEVARLRKMVYEDARIAEKMDPSTDSYLPRVIVNDPSVSLAERERLLQKSLAVNPQSGMAWNRYADLLRDVGRTRESLDDYERAVSVDPLGSQDAIIGSAIRAAQVGNIEFARKRFDDARRTFLPDQVIDHLRFWTELWFGDAAVTETLNEDPSVFYFDGVNKETTAGSDSCSLAFIHARVRNIRLSEAELDKACPDTNKQAYGYFGYVDAALRQWEADFNPKHPMWGAEFLFVSFNRTIRADPRFMHLAARMGLVDYWLDTDHWPDFCKEEKLQYDCKEAALAARVNAKS